MSGVSGKSLESLPESLESLWRVSGESPRESLWRVSQLPFTAFLCFALPESPESLWRVSGESPRVSGDSPRVMNVLENLWRVSGKLLETPPESLRVSGESPESLPKALERLWRVS